MPGGEPRRLAEHEQQLDRIQAIVTETRDLLTAHNPAAAAEHRRELDRRLDVVESRLDKGAGTAAIWGAITGLLTAIGSLLAAFFSGLLKLKGG